MKIVLQNNNKHTFIELNNILRRYIYNNTQFDGGFFEYE